MSAAEPVSAAGWASCAIGPGAQRQGDDAIAAVDPRDVLAAGDERLVGGQQPGIEQLPDRDQHRRGPASKPSGSS